ncbi:hypothetical protein HNR46_004179 [Haloferula luteola]|uniref:Uncharacterized protein n=1 Tax=Haloferula luteola TaxID=595692 RepID=A0A840VEI5_9BACT|nr:hypothetical protein [Haloferula luteola]
MMPDIMLVHSLFEPFENDKFHDPVLGSAEAGKYNEVSKVLSMVRKIRTTTGVRTIGNTTATAIRRTHSHCRS